MRQAKRFLWNTALLTATSLLMRFLGMGFQVYLSKKIGAAGIGLFELLMSVYGFSVALASSGIRLSTIRLVVEHGSQGRASPRSVMRLCLRYSLLLGTAAGALLFTAAPLVSARWLDQPDLLLCLRMLAVSLPFLSVSSCLSGYFSALRKAGSTAAIQVFDFGFQVALTIVALSILLPYGTVMACTALVIGSCGAEVCALIFSYVLYKHQQKREPSAPASCHLLRALLNIAVPDAVGSWVRSGLVTAKHLLIPKGLRQTGISAENALATYGVIHGMALPVISFPSAFLATVSTLLIPEIAESHSCKQTGKLLSIMGRVMHMTLLFSFFVTGILLFQGQLLGQLLYGTATAGRYIQLLAPLVPLMYLDMAVDGMLKGMGLQSSSMRINILDASVSLLLVSVLIPRIGIQGYLATIFISETLNFTLSYRCLHRTAGLQITLYKNVLAPLLASLTAVFFSIWILPGATAVGLCLRIAVAAGFYYGLLRVLGSITRTDVQWFLQLFRS